MSEERKHLPRILQPFQEVRAAIDLRRQFAFDIASVTALGNTLTHPNFRDFIKQQEDSSEQIVYRSLTFSDMEHSRQVLFQVGVRNTGNNAEQIQSLNISSVPFGESIAEVNDNMHVQLEESGPIVTYTGDYYTEGLPRTDTLSPKYVSLEAQFIPKTSVISHNSDESLMTEASYSRRLQRGFLESPLVSLRKVRLIVSSLPPDFEYNFNMPYSLRRLERSQVFSLERRGNNEIFIGRLGENHESVAVPLDNQLYLEHFTQLVNHLKSVFPLPERINS